MNRRTLELFSVLDKYLDKMSWEKIDSGDGQDNKFAHYENGDDVIFIDFIKSVGIEEDNQILAIEFYNRYRSDVLTDLLY